MESMTSTELYQRDFSPDPTYTIDSPPTAYQPVSLRGAHLSLADMPLANFSISGEPDDPAVVSDDSNVRNIARDASIAFCEFLTKKKLEYGSTDSVSVGNGMAHLLENVDLISRNFLHSILAPMKRDSHGIQYPAPALNDWVALSLAVNPSRTQESFEKLMLGEAATEFSAILSELLIPHSFSKPSKYDDVFGGVVIDLYRNFDRISCVISEQKIQMLSSLGGVFKNKIFERTKKSKLAVVDHIESLIE